MFSRKFVAAIAIFGALMSTQVFTEEVFAAEALEQSLLNKLANAQTSLSATEKRIARERHNLAEELNALEQEALALQKETSVARRLADEKTLSLSQLESRLDAWHEQQAYQHNLLNRFLQQHKAGADPVPTQLTAQIDAVVQLGHTLEQRFFPRWNTAEVIVGDGVLETMPLLSVGPVNWFWQESTGRAGVAALGDNGLQSEFLLSGNQSSGIEALLAGADGTLAFDPTLDRAMVREQNAESILEHVAKGGFWVIPILLFGAFALAIALFKVVELWRLPKLVRLTPTVLKSLIDDPERPVPAAVEGMQQQLLNVGRTEQTPRSRDDRLFIHLQEHRNSLERWIGAIAITASVSPLLGLLGTVSGMIETFKMMTLFGAGDPEVVSGGIAQALVTTELGLIVAIPALILHAILNRRARNYYMELENFAILLGQCDEDELFAISNEQKAQQAKQKTTVQAKDEPAHSEADALETGPSGTVNGVPA